MRIKRGQLTIPCYTVDKNAKDGKARIPSKARFVVVRFPVDHIEDRVVSIPKGRKLWLHTVRDNCTLKVFIKDSEDFLHMFTSMIVGDKDEQ